MDLGRDPSVAGAAAALPGETNAGRGIVHSAVAYTRDSKCNIRDPDGSPGSRIVTDAPTREALWDPSSNAPGVVADQGKVIDLSTTAVVPYGTFTGCVKTQEWTPFEPGNRAFKVYAEGIGTVVESPNKSEGRVELIAVQRP
jgi:hypothetical protein